MHLHTQIIQTVTDTTDGVAATEEKRSSETIPAVKPSSSPSKKSRKLSKENISIAGPSGLSGDYGYSSRGSQAYLSGNSSAGGGYTPYSSGVGEQNSSGYADEYPSITEEEMLMQGQGMGNQIDSNGGGMSQAMHDGVRDLSRQQHILATAWQQSLPPLSQHQVVQQQQQALLQHNHPVPPPHYLNQQQPISSIAHHGNEFMTSAFPSNNHSVSSGFYTIPNSSPAKLKKPTPDAAVSSINSSTAHSSSNLSNSFSTFSSDRSNISLQSSSSDPTIYHPLSPASSGLFPPRQLLDLQRTDFAAERHIFKHPLRLSNSYSPDHHHQPIHTHHVRRHSDELLSNTSFHPWTYSYTNGKLNELTASMPSTDISNSYPTNLRMETGYEKDPKRFQLPQNGFMSGSDSTLPLTHFDNLPEAHARAYGQERVFSRDGQFGRERLVYHRDAPSWRQ